MKRVLWGLSIVCLIILGGSAAFALDTNKIVITPTPNEYRSALKGAKDVGVGGWGDVLFFLQDFDPKATQELRSILENQEALGRETVVALITIFFNGASPVDYNWADNEALLNFLSFVFHKYADVVNVSSVADEASRIHRFDGTSQYEYYYAPDNYSRFVSIKDVGDEKSDGGGGCAAFPLGAVVLFLLPALVLVKRRVK